MPKTHPHVAGFDARYALRLRSSGVALPSRFADARRRYDLGVLNPEISLDDSLSARIGRATALDPVAISIQAPLRSARDANPAIKSALAGTWIGHALHPMLTDVPVGACTILATLDAVELAGANDMQRASNITLGVAIASAYAAVVTGWADWSDTHEEPRRIGLVHAVLNGTALVAYQASLVLRLTNRRAAGIATGFAGYALLAAGSYLGAELTTRLQIGVRHTANVLAPPDKFVDVAALTDVPSDRWLRVEANGSPILLTRSDDGVSAVGAVCSHRGGPLEEGTREGDCVRCPWHHARFSLRDGSVMEGPATFGLPRYEVRISEDRIAVRAAG